MDGICVCCGKILQDISKNICEECKKKQFEMFDHVIKNILETNFEKKEKK